MKGGEKMKRGNLFTGLVFLCVGIGCWLIAVTFGTKLESLLYGFAFGGIINGAVLLWKYYYWSRPQNRGKYQEKVEIENIELQDERKSMLRDKSGRYAYIVGLIVLSVSIVIFSVIGTLTIIENYILIISYLTGFSIFQYVIGVLIFNHLNKKH